MMSAKQQKSGFLEADEKEEGSTDVDNNSEMMRAGTSTAISALTSDEIVNFLISDEMANLPSEPKNPEITQDSLEHGLVAEQPAEAGACQSWDFLK